MSAAWLRSVHTFCGHDAGTLFKSRLLISDILCSAADCSRTTSAPTLPVASALFRKKFQIDHGTVILRPEPPTTAATMISASLTICRACWAGSAGGKAVGMATDVDLVFWVEKGLLTASGGRTMIVSLPAEIVCIVVGLSVVEGADLMGGV